MMLNGAEIPWNPRMAHEGLRTWKGSYVSGGRRPNGSLLGVQHLLSLSGLPEAESRRPSAELNAMLRTLGYDAELVTPAQVGEWISAIVGRRLLLCSSLLGFWAPHKPERRESRFMFWGVLYINPKSG